MAITTTRITQMHDVVKTLQDGPESVEEILWSKGTWLGEELERACLRYFRYGGSRKQFNTIWEICIWWDKLSHVKKPLSQVLGQ